MEHMGVPRSDRRCRHRGDPHRQPSRVGNPLLSPASQLGQLDTPNRSVDVSHPSVEADQLVLVTSLHALIAQEASLSFEFWVSGDDHAALPSRHVLGRVEAEGSERSETPDRGAVDRRCVSLSSVFEHHQAVLLSNRHDLGHVGRVAVEVDRHDRRGLGRDRGADCIGI